MELIDFVAGLISGLISGGVVGYVVEHYRFKDNLKIESMKRLTPYIELVYPIVEQIHDDVVYFQKTQMRTNPDDDESFTQKICKAFDEFGSWYGHFQRDGLKPELAAVDRTLFTLLSGLFVHATMTRKYGSAHVSREVKEISKASQACLSKIEQFLSF